MNKTEKMKLKDLILKSLLVVILSSLVLTQTAAAEDKRVAQELLKSKLEAVLAVLQKKECTQEQKDKIVIEIVEPIFDFSVMAKLTLGRKYWPGLTAEKKARFKELFTKRLKQNYLGKMTLYTNETIVYNEPVKVKKKIHIPTDLISKENKISMLYKFYKSKGNWKIYDIEIEGVSIISTYRSQFNQFLDKGTIDDLLQKLEKPEDK